MLKVGVLGAGHLGKIHLRLLNESEKYDLIGFYDPDAINGKKAADEFGYTYFDNINTLIDAVDMVDIVTPTHEREIFTRLWFMSNLLKSLLIILSGLLLVMTLRCGKEVLLSLKLNQINSFQNP